MIHDGTSFFLAYPELFPVPTSPRISNAVCSKSQEAELLLYIDINRYMYLGCGG